MKNRCFYCENSRWCVHNGNTYYETRINAPGHRRKTCSEEACPLGKEHYKKNIEKKNGTK